MKPTKILSEEHKNILKVVAALEKECAALESGKQLDKEFIRNAIDFIRNYADKFHHAKEEDILFKEFCKKEEELHCNPVGQMLYEHDLGRGYVKGMEQGIEENDKEMVIKNGKEYVQLLQEHIMKEDNILFPMADQVLNEEAQASISKKFKEAENKKFKKGTKERYIAFAGKLGG